LLFLAGTPAFAGLLGKSIDMTYEFGPSRYTNTVLVGAGSEINCPAGAFAMCGNALTASDQFLDADDTSITYSYDGKSGPQSFIPLPFFSGFEFANLDVGGNILGPIVLTTNIAGLDMSRVSSTASMIRVNMEGRDVVAGSYFTVSFASAAIPEPSTFALLLAGLGTVLAARGLRR
jgi:hypothetical protein